MGAFSCHGNQTKRQITKKFGYFQRTLTKQHSFQVRYKSLQWLWRSCHFKVLTDRQPNRCFNNLGLGAMSHYEFL